MRAPRPTNARVAAGPRFAPGIKHAPNRPPCQRGRERRSGDCPPEKYRPRWSPAKTHAPSVKDISRRNNPSVLASLGHLPLTREAKTVPAAANRADMESAPTGVCITKRPPGRCKHRPLHRFVITHGRGHPGRPQHHRGCAAPAAFCRIILPFRRAACYNRQKPPHKTHQGGRRWN